MSGLRVEYDQENGVRGGKQLYKCQKCGHQFRQRSGPTDEKLWQMYQDGKQTISELANALGISTSTIRRRLSSLDVKWEQPPLSGGGYVHVDYVLGAQLGCVACH